jgi:hypothetical protein
LFIVRLASLVARDCEQTARLNVSPGPVAALVKVKNPNAPAVKRDAEKTDGIQAARPVRPVDKAALLALKALMQCSEIVSQVRPVPYHRGLAVRTKVFFS